jgi:hypothetical protein
MQQRTWLKCTNPSSMLEHLGAAASDRALRLFSCACCRRAWGFAKDPRLNQVLAAVEGYADGKVKERERGRANTTGATLRQSSKLDDPQQCLGGELWRASKKALDRADCNLGDLAAAFGWAAGADGNFGKAKKAERAQQAPLVREIFGNPFRPVTFSAAWRTSDVVLLANGIYDERAFDRMPILADALQEVPSARREGFAGCTSDALLNHLRDTGAPHVRGCWALDVVLDKRRPHPQGHR